MSVKTLLALIEYFVGKLYDAAEEHIQRGNDLAERIETLKEERDRNLQEAKRARAVADKIADLIS